MGGTGHLFFDFFYLFSKIFSWPYIRRVYCLMTCQEGKKTLIGGLEKTIHWNHLKVAIETLKWLTIRIVCRNLIIKQIRNNQPWWSCDLWRDCYHLHFALCLIIFHTAIFWQLFWATREEKRIKCLKRNSIAKHRGSNCTIPNIASTIYWGIQCNKEIWNNVTVKFSQIKTETNLSKTVSLCIPARNFC